MKWAALQAGDVWGGLAAMLVALPSAIAFGVAIYFPLGAEYAAQGAMAGLLGAVAIGLIAAALGGTQRLVSAPCAPAAAVLAAFALEHMQGGGGTVVTAVLLLTLLGLAAGALQVVFGLLRLGQLIVYMPYPVVSGYLSGVGLYIIAGQIPKLLGTPKDLHFWDAVLSPGAWQWQGIVVALVTMAVMLGAPRLTTRVPAAIIGLLAGVGTYFLLGLHDPALLRLEGNSFVVGALSAGGDHFGAALAARWQAIGEVGLTALEQLIVPALTLAVLLSIDTLKTCVVLDAMTRTRHDSNRELIGQGLANLGSACIGGVPGAGTMGATLVNIASGAQTRASGVLEGVFALLAFLLLGSVIAWVPVAALAGILIVIGVRMIDTHSLVFLRHRSTMLDFAVIAAVVVTALTVSLIAASGIGVALAMMLFIREEIGGTIVRRKVPADQVFSKRIRTAEEMAVLTQHGKRAVAVELQGALFFGTAHQLQVALEPELKTRDFVILDMRRVQTVDVTAVHVLEQIEDTLGERGGLLIITQIPASLPSGRDMGQFFRQTGLVRAERPVRVFAELDDALEWIEDRIIADVQLDGGEEHALELHELEMFAGRKPETLRDLAAHVVQRRCAAGEKIFAAGDTGDELFIIRKGSVRIVLPISATQSHHLGTFGRGAFFGEMAFLDGAVRSADAVAFTDVELFVLSRRTFDAIADEHKRLALALMAGIASVLASRLRYTNAELRVLES